MVHVTIQHVAGTVALICLVASVGFSFSLTSAYFRSDVLTQQMEDIAEYVSQNFVEIVTLIRISDFVPLTLMRILNLPSSLDGRVYVVELVEGEGSHEGFQVHVYLMTEPTVSVRCPLLFNFTQDPVKFATDLEGGTLLDGKIRYSNAVHSVAERIVAWGWMDGEEILAGIGVWTGE